MKTNEEYRAHTPEELRDILLSYMRLLAGYWANLKEDKTVLERIEGAMFSVLSILDGSHGTCTFDLVARVDPTDKQYHIENGENWVEDGTKLDFMLHEFWHKDETEETTKALRPPHTHCALKEDLFGTELILPNCEMIPVKCAECNNYVGTCLKIPLSKTFDATKEKPILVWSNETLSASCWKCGRETEITGTKGHTFWVENIIKRLLEERGTI